MAACSSVIYRLRQGWRILATGISFALFGIGTLVLTLVWAPVICLVWREPAIRRQRFQHVYHRGCRFFIRFMRAVGVLSWEVHGDERLLAPGHLMLANHPTLIDAVFFLAFMPEAVCIVKAALWRNAFLGWAVRVAGYIGNTSPNQLIADCVARLHAGNCLVVFPEGTRTVPGQPMVLQRGAARIALAAGVPVVPVRIRCEPITLFKHQKWYQVPPRTPHYRFDVGSPLPAFAAREGESRSAAARRVTAELKRVLAVDPEAGT